LGRDFQNIEHMFATLLTRWDRFQTPD
jgi:hypothetical protein